MSNKEFWDDDPELLWAYRKSYMDKLHIQHEFNNYTAWLNGIYIFDAMSKCLYNAFGKKEGQPAINYVSEPYDFNAKSKSKEELEKEKRLEIEAKIKERNEQIKIMLKNKK